MKAAKGMTYRDVGVLSNEELGLDALLKWVRPTEAFRRGRPAGRSLLDIGYFANVIDIGHGLGLALTTDGVGTKVLVAEMMQRYDTIGIDCVAMNVNDIICVGAEPVSMLDYIAVEKADAGVLEAIGAGLHEGARQAGVNIVGGELSQMKELIRGQTEGSGIDLVGMCVGLVAADRINVGQDVVPGDVIVGLRSDGLHSNGFTLARRCLFGSGALRPDTRVAELGRTAGEELLAPTRIYVKEVRHLLEAGVPVRAMVHVTSYGFLNLARIRPAVSFVLDRLPEPQPIFRLVQESGRVPDEEMFAVFNMGIGFCLILPDDKAALAQVHATMKAHGVPSFEIGRVVEGPDRTVHLPQWGLVGRGDRFEKPA